MLRLFADSFWAEPKKVKGRVCSELTDTMWRSTLQTKFQTEKMRIFSKNLASHRFPESSERAAICINLFQSPHMREEFFLAWIPSNQRMKLLSRLSQTPLAMSKAKLMVWEELGTDFPLTSLSQLWQETTTSLLFRCLMQSEQSVIKNNDSVYVTRTKIQRCAILCRPQAPSICCCQLPSSAVQFYNVFFLWNVIACVFSWGWQEDLPPCTARFTL